jgi:hypothetical protein
VIGTLAFWRGHERIIVSLDDTAHWSCPDAQHIADYLNRNATPDKIPYSPADATFGGLYLGMGARLLADLTGTDVEKEWLVPPTLDEPGRVY